MYVFTDFGAGSMTSSGYPRIVKEWKRGTPLAAGTHWSTKARPSDMYIAASHDHTPGFERDFVSRTLAFYNDELYLRDADGKLRKVDAPNSANKSVHREWLLLELREPYERRRQDLPGRRLIATRFDDFMAGKRDFTCCSRRRDSTSLAGFSWTRHHLVLNVLDDVKNRLSVLTPGDGGWKHGEFTGAPTFGTLARGRGRRGRQRCRVADRHRLPDPDHAVAGARSASVRKRSRPCRRSSTAPTT